MTRNKMIGNIMRIQRDILDLKQENRATKAQLDSYLTSTLASIHQCHLLDEKKGVSNRNKKCGYQISRLKS